MDIDSVGLAKTSESEIGERTGVANKPFTQNTSPPSLDIPPQDMMDVDPQMSAQFTASIATEPPQNGVVQSRAGRIPAAYYNRKILPSPGGTQTPGHSLTAAYGRKFLLHAASMAARTPVEDAAGAIGMSPVPTPPVVVLTSSDVASWPLVLPLLS